MVNVELPDSWEKVNLGNALSYIGNGLTDKQNKVNDGYPVTRIETISDDCINADKVGYISTLPEDKIEKYRLCYGDMLVSHINSDPQLGRSVIYEGNPEFLLHGMNLLRMRANTKVLAPFFLNLIFRFYRNRGVFIALASRAVGQSSINQSRMKSLIIPLPPLPEQRAIAHAFYRQSKRRKPHGNASLALERERKAALMDYLFSYGTKGEPRKQTEIGEIPESWELGTISEICEQIIDYRGRTPKFSESGIVHLRSSNVKEGRLTLKNDEITYVTDETYKSFMTRGLPKAGDIIFTTEGPLGESAMVPPNFRFSLAQRMVLLRADKTVLDSSYLLYVLYSEQVRKEYLGRATGSTAKGISSKNFQQVQVPLPCLPEQREIAISLTACDAKIVALEQEAEHLDELFHAMLDELMTGQRSAVPLIDAELPN